MMKTIISIILGTAALVFPIAKPASPLNLNFGVKEKAVPEIADFRYWYGDSTWGQIIYNGTKDLDGLQTELHLEYSSSRILQGAVLIFGPSGINGVNCVAVYKRIVGALNKKYGHFVYRKELKDPLAHDLVFNRYCNQVRAALHETGTFWQTPKFRIELWLFGDEEDIFIEVDYLYLPQKKKKNNLFETL